MREVSSGRVCTLDGHTLIGRGAHCGLTMSYPFVSNDHASLTWSESEWVIRDLASTNGSWVNGVQIAKGEDIALGLGDRMAFGDRDAVWQLVEADAPAPMATPLSGGPACALVDGIITVPDADQPEATIFCNQEGNWTLERATEVKAIAPGGLFDAGGAAWRFSCPSQWQPTRRVPEQRLIQTSAFQFRVSSDEEAVSLSVDTGQETVAMGSSSIYYFLVTLARLRVKDENLAAAEECGWVHREELMRMLRCDAQLLNVWVCRIRAKFASAGFLDYASVIERRDGTGQLRIGAGQCVVS